MVKGKPREDILGLPHTEEGCDEAKKILNDIYGKDVKVHKQLINEIESLQPITNIHKLKSIHEFYNKLARTVRTLTTTKKLDSAQCLVYTLMDKLGPVREIIAQEGDNWEDRNLEELVEIMKRYVERNPLQNEWDCNYRDESNRQRHQNYRKEKLLMQQRRTMCIYCESGDHLTNKCTRVLDVASRRDILRKKGVCFNCTSAGHRVSHCKSRSCFKCGQKHHTSICESIRSSIDQLSTANESSPDKMKEDTRANEQPVEKGMSSMMESSSTIHH